MTFSQLKYKLEAKLLEHERLFISIFLLMFSMITLVDVIEDLSRGSGLPHILLELMVAIVTLAVAGFFFRTFIKDRNSTLFSTKKELKNAKAEARAWKAQAEQLKNGVSTAISAQLASWKLSEAEEDVAFLLLKGLSLKEIATIRNSSERTIRQQASVIYKKSNLAGRAELSAFFLEDLFDRSA